MNRNYLLISIKVILKNIYIYFLFIQKKLLNIFLINTLKSLFDENKFSFADTNSFVNIISI